jgi:TolB protein
MASLLCFLLTADYRLPTTAFLLSTFYCLQSTLPSAPPATARQLTTDRDFKQHLTWSPDGKKLLYTRIHKGKMGLWTCDADGSHPIALLKDEQPHFDGCWSPDGKQIAYVYDIFQGTDGKFQINVVPSGGGASNVFVPNNAFEESPRWSPDGKHLAFVSTRDGNQEIYVSDGKNVRRLTSEIAADYSPSWSPDGKRIAFTSARFGNLEICSMDAEGRDIRRLTNHPGMDYWPIWSPDGKRIAFTSNRDGNYEIYLMNADGTGVSNLTHHPSQDNYPTWSPDGKQIAFVSNRAGGYDIFVMAAP